MFLNSKDDYVPRPLTMSEDVQITRSNTNIHSTSRPTKRGPNSESVFKKGSKLNGIR